MRKLPRPSIRLGQKMQIRWHRHSTQKLQLWMKKGRRKSMLVRLTALVLWKGMLHSILFLRTANGGMLKYQTQVQHVQTMQLL